MCSYLFYQQQQSSNEPVSNQLYPAEIWDNLGSDPSASCLTYVELLQNVE